MIGPAAAVLLALAAPERDGAASGGYRPALAPRAFAFPRDHASHPEHRTEWWYYTGHLRGGGRSFGYELAFFRVGLGREREASPSAWAPHTVLFAHLALTDEDRRAFRHAGAISRPALGMAGADTAWYRVWVHDWSAELLEDGRTHRLRARGDGLAVALELAPLKPPVVHGTDGVIRKAEAPGTGSHYVSITRLATRGTVVADGDSVAVSGRSWMDHEFGEGRLAPDHAGWDWFGVQLDDGRELMLYRLRRADGSTEPLSSGTLVRADGTHRRLPLAAFAIEATGRWTSPRSGAVYPHGWRIRVPGEDLTLDLTPTVADQELATGAAGGVIYWEGSVRAAGSSRGRRVTGEGYVELTGYAGPPPGP